MSRPGTAGLQVGLEPVAPPVKECRWTMSIQVGEDRVDRQRLTERVATGKGIDGNVLDDTGGFLERSSGRSTGHGLVPVLRGGKDGTLGHAHVVIVRPVACGRVHGGDKDVTVPTVSEIRVETVSSGVTVGPGEVTLEGLSGSVFHRLPSNLEHHTRYSHGVRPGAGSDTRVA